MLEAIGEAIRVCVYFGRGRISPLWFTWKGRHYPVEEVRNRWVTSEGTGRSYHFAVAVAERADLYELSFRTETMSWYLARISVNG